MCGRAGSPAMAPGGEEKNPVRGHTVRIENSSRASHEVLLQNQAEKESFQDVSRAGRSNLRLSICFVE